jgi:hypothetical protein
MKRPKLASNQGDQQVVKTGDSLSDSLEIGFPLRAFFPNLLITFFKLGKQNTFCFV